MPSPVGRRALRNRFIAEMADAEVLDFPVQASVVGQLRQAPSNEARAAFMPFCQAGSLMRELTADALRAKVVLEAQAILS